MHFLEPLEHIVVVIFFLVIIVLLTLGIEPLEQLLVLKHLVFLILLCKVLNVGLTLRLGPRCTQGLTSSLMRDLNIGLGLKSGSRLKLSVVAAEASELTWAVCQLVVV